MKASIAGGAEARPDHSISCSGKFASGALPEESSGEKHAFTSCTGLKGTVTSYYFVVPGKTGGHYVFAVAGAENVASTADMRIKPAILKAVMTR